MRARGTTLAPGDADAGAGTTARDAARTERGADIDECAMKSVTTCPRVPVNVAKNSFSVYVYTT